MVAIICGLLSGLLFGLTAHVQRLALQDTEVAFGAFISILTMALGLWIMAPFLLDPAWLQSRALWTLALCGVMFPAMSQSLQVASVVRVGPAVTSGIGSVAPLFAVSLAVLFLGEHLNLQGALGIGVMLAGLLISTLGPGEGITRGFPLWALALPLGASAARGIVQPVTKYTMIEVPSAYFGALVMSTAAACVLGLWTLTVRARRPLRWSSLGNFYFIVTGLLVGGGILALQISIHLGSVSLAAPLSSTTPLWTLVLGLAFFRVERLTHRHLIMALLVVIGVTLVVTR